MDRANMVILGNLTSALERLVQDLLVVMQAATAWRSLRLSKGASLMRKRMTAVCAVVTG